MLKPAICYKEEIEDALKEYFYTDDMMWYVGYVDSSLIHILDKGENGNYQYAVVSEDGEYIIGYIAYSIDLYSSCAYNFGAFSFDRGNPLMGKELYNVIEKLIARFHRVEFRAIGGNPATKGYDRLLKIHSDIGTKHILRDTFRDTNGNYHDEYIYEFINPNNKGGTL